MGKPAAFRVTVRNTGPVAASEVEVRDQVPRGTRLLGTTPRGQARHAGRIGLDAGHASGPARKRRRDAAYADGRGRDRQRGDGPFRGRRLGPLGRHPAATGRRDRRAGQGADRRADDAVDRDFQSGDGHCHRRGAGGADSARLAASGRQRVGISGGRPEAGREPPAGSAAGGQPAGPDDERAGRPAATATCGPRTSGTWR